MEQDEASFRAKTWNLCDLCSLLPVFDQERRVEKKANKVAFKEEKVRQEKQMLNLRSNVQGLKL